MICRHCSNTIPSERAEILIDLDLPRSCMPCSKVQAPVVLMSFEHKTGGAPMVIPNNEDGTRNEELVRKAMRCFKRER